MKHDQQKNTRRAFLRQMGMAAGLAPVLAGFHGDAATSCNDTTKLTDQQKEARRALKYVDRSPHSDKHCNNCRFFSAPGQGQTCGGCTALPGPIHPQGYCTAWTAKA